MCKLLSIPSFKIVIHSLDIQIRNHLLSPVMCFVYCRSRVIFLFKEYSYHIASLNWPKLFYKRTPQALTSRHKDGAQCSDSFRYHCALYWEVYRALRVKGEFKIPSGPWLATPFIAHAMPVFFSSGQAGSGSKGKRRSRQIVPRRHFVPFHNAPGANLYFRVVVKSHAWY